MKNTTKKVYLIVDKNNYFVPYTEKYTLTAARGDLKLWNSIYPMLAPHRVVSYTRDIA